jgi:hypothetical protein
MNLKIQLKKIWKKNGLLCPMVIDMNNNLRNGTHRLKVLTKLKLADGSFIL